MSWDAWVYQAKPVQMSAPEEILLEPCPYCGAFEPRVDLDYEFDTQNWRLAVRCVFCNAKAEGVIAKKYVEDMDPIPQADHGLYLEAIRFWNEAVEHGKVLQGKLVYHVDPAGGDWSKITYGWQDDDEGYPVMVSAYAKTAEEIDAYLKLVSQGESFHVPLGAGKAGNITDHIWHPYGSDDPEE